MRQTARIMVASLLFTTAGTAACGPDDPPSPSDPTPPATDASVEERLQELPGVQGASVVRNTIEQDGPEVTEVAVDLEPDPTLEVIVGALDAVSTAGTGRTAVYVDDDAPYNTGFQVGLSGIRSADEDVDAQATAELLRSGLDLLEMLPSELAGSASVDIDLDPTLESTGPPPVIVVAVPGASPGEVAELEADVADDPVLGDEAVTVFAE